MAGIIALDPHYSKGDRSGCNRNLKPPASEGGVFTLVSGDKLRRVDLDRTFSARLPDTINRRIRDPRRFLLFDAVLCAMKAAHLDGIWDRPAGLLAQPRPSHEEIDGPMSPVSEVALPARRLSGGGAEFTDAAFVRLERPIKEKQRMKTAKHIATGMVALGLFVAGNAQADQALAQAKGCMACHQVAVKVVGPAYKDVAAKYKDQADAADVLAAKVKAGGVGTWGQIPMPPQPTLSDDEVKTLVAWVLAQ